MIAKSKGLLVALITLLALGLLVPALAQTNAPTADESISAGVTVDLDQCANQTTPCGWQNGDLTGYALRNAAVWV